MTTGIFLALSVVTSTTAVTDSIAPVFNDEGKFADLDDLVVTATRTPKSLKDVPVVTRLISADEIKKSDATNIQDLLTEELPGLEFGFVMSQETSLNMNGFAGNAVLFLVDGERLAGETMDNVDYNRLNLGNVGRVEVVKGAASALYGANAVGGVVNLISKESTEPWHVSLDSRYRSFGNEWRAGGEVSFNAGNWNSNTSVQYNRSSTVNLTYAFDTKSKIHQVFGGHTLNIKERLIFRPLQNLRLIARGSWFDRTSTRANYDDRYKDYSGGLKGVWDISSLDQLEISYGYDQYDKSRYVDGQRTHGHDYSNRQNTVHSLYSRFLSVGTLTVGAGYMHDYLSTYQFIDNAAHSQYSVDAFAQFDYNPLRWLNVVGSLREDYFSGAKTGADEKSLRKMEAALKKKSVVAAKGAKTPVESGPAFSSTQIELATAVADVERAIRNVASYSDALRMSPEKELTSLVNALSGGFIAPTSGGDPVLNPDILPTGRNMFAVNAEETPSAVAWEKGKALADNTIAMYRKAHGDSLPRKVSYTLWSSEFIETEGATIAQVLYMLGVEPVRDPFGRVTDLRLIPSEELGRPRIDVVVQTSGQLRDLAASRLFLIGRAVKMAAGADDKHYPNFVKEGVVESERHLVNKGVSPKEARELSTSRVFGGVNGNYGSGIQEMVEAGDRWDNSDEIAQTYMNNMGAVYGSEEDWEQMREYAFEAALTRTDVVVQPRQSNTWGALSLDHVYEFMGGLDLAVRNVTGKDPEAYMSDYRNRSNARMQDVKEAIGIESRSTILNPEYIKEKMKRGAGDAASMAEVVTNTYGWNVMKPEAIDNELWNDIYDTYVADKNHLGVKEYFSDKNPAAIQEMTAVMLETARKGMWKASPDQIRNLAALHTEMVGKHGAACSGFVCDNAKLRDYIAANVSAPAAAAYKKEVAAVRAENVAGDNGKVMKREEMNSADQITNRINGAIVAAIVAAALIVFTVVIRRRRRNGDNDDLGGNLPAQDF